MPAARPRVLVIGSGLAGLAAAESLVRGRESGGLEVTVVDPSARVGGVLGTVLDAGWLVERSADCFLAVRPEAISLVERIGLGDQVIGVEPRARRALVWHAGRCRPVPAGFRLLAPGRVRPILTTPLLSLRGRGRLLWERFVPRPRGASDDESLEHFAIRRLGREAFERLVQPLAAGIWTADPARLSMAAACPEFLSMERDAGSLWAGERIRQRGTVGPDQATGARYGQFVTLRSGMQALPQRLAERLRSFGVRFVTGRVTAVSRDAEGRWRVVGPGLDEAAVGNVDALVVATPAHAAAEMLGSLDASLAGELTSIDYAGSCIVSLGYARDHVGHPLDAAGLVIPRIAGRAILAVSFSSSKFPGRAPPGCVLLRVFVGGALDPDAMQLADAVLVERARAEVAELLAARGEPRLVHVERWDRAMPQYHLGHASRMARIDASVARHPGLALAGAAYTGVGIPQVIASGQAAAETCRRCLP